MQTAPISGPQTLLIDADDTLWENNIYFERAIAKFISFLRESVARYRRLLVAPPPLLQFSLRSCDHFLH